MEFSWNIIRAAVIMKCQIMECYCYDFIPFLIIYIINVVVFLFYVVIPFSRTCSKPLKLIPMIEPLKDRSLS